MTELVASVPDLTRSEEWSSIKEDLEIRMCLGDKQVQLELSAQPTKTGQLYYLLCPQCGGRRRDLYVKADALGCRTCLKIRHADQLVPRSRWGREVVIPVRQVKRIEVRLARPGPDRNTRRRLHRRRRVLLKRIAMELSRRQLEMKDRLGCLAEDISAE